MDQVNKAAMPPFDDIPEAARDTPIDPPPQAKTPSRNWFWLMAPLGVAALAAGGWMAWYQATQVNAQFNEPIRGVVTGAAVVNGPPGEEDSGEQLQIAHRTLLGHRAYNEAPEEDLVPLDSNPEIRLLPSAAEQFEAMRQAAAREGHTLIPISGFRTYEEQQHLFFDIKAERGQNTTTRAEVSAPPGYSEHHTGYAIDLGDGTQPETHLNESFADTETFAWLQENANRFDFELSFPPDNLQGVAFEPWHWRFVGDPESLETFYAEEEVRNVGSSNAGQTESDQGRDVDSEGIREQESN